MADKVPDDRGASDAKVTIEEEKPDDFGAGFDEAAEKGDKADLSAADNPENVKKEPPAEEPKKEEPPKAETPPPEQQPGESDEKYEQRYKTLQGILKHDKESWEAEKAQLLAAIEEAKKPKTPEPAKEPTKEETAAAEKFIDSLTDEQKEQLEQYEQDFDVVSKMEGLKRAKELAALRKEMQEWKADIAQQIAAQKETLAPVVAKAEEDERTAHFNMIRQGYTLEDGTVVPGHPDFEQFRDDGSLVAWIESKPAYLQPALKKAYQGGTAQDVIDLYTDFKRDNKIPVNYQPESQENVIPIDSKKAQKKQALSSVTSRRGAVNAGVAIADDYEGAWDEAQNKSGG